MFGSLRFRLAALFLLGIVLAGLVASLISIRFFQSYTRARAIDELRAESVGIVQLYARQAGGAAVPVNRLSRALGGDKIFWVPAVRGDRRAQAGEADDRRDHVAGPRLSRGRAAAAARGKPLRRARGREAAVAAAQPLDRADRAAGDRARRRRDRRRPPRLLSVPAGHGSAACALGGRGRGRSRQLRGGAADAARIGRDRAPVGTLLR